MASCAAAVLSAAVGAFASAAQAEPVVVDDSLGATQLLGLANAERAAANLAPLELRTDVYELALDHSRRMAAAGDISHNDGYFTPAVRQRLGAKTLGENVAMNKSAEDAHRRLMLSPDHRANLMNPKFTVVGIAMVRSLDGMGFITQDFVEPIAGAHAALPVPVPAAAPAPPPAESPADSPPPAEPASATPPADPPAAASAPAPNAPASTAKPAPPPPAPPVDGTALMTPEPAAPATTTTALEVVSVVTEPISNSAPEAAQAAAGGDGPSSLLPVGVAVAVLAIVATAALCTYRRKGQPNSGV